MRQFYFDEGPIDTLLQIAAGPVSDGNLVSKSARDLFVQMDWVARCQGYNIITSYGEKAIHALRLCRTMTVPVNSVDRPVIADCDMAVQRTASECAELKR